MKSPWLFTQNSMPEEIEYLYDGDSIEQLGTLRRSTGLRVIVQTGDAA